MSLLEISEGCRLDDGFKHIRDFFSLIRGTVYATATAHATV